MNPFTLPWPTSGYVALYLVTLLVHGVFMSYVLAGAPLLALGKASAALRRDARSVAVSVILADWLPFSLSAAITAGIAPLLFVQILYQEEFYTANLLSFHRWMILLPVLILAFYLLYILKAKADAPRATALAATAVAAAVVFVAWSWVENHMLSLDRGSWRAQYAAGSMTYRDPAVFARIAFWIGVAFPTAAHLLVRQLRAGASGTDASTSEAPVRLLGRIAAVALVVSTVLAIPVLQGSWAHFRPDLGANASAAHLALAIMAVGAGLQLVTWLYRPGQAWSLRVGAVGLLAFWWGILSHRELTRLASVDLPRALLRHQAVGTVSGIGVFLTFTTLAAMAIGWIAVAVRRDLAQSTPPAAVTNQPGTSP